MNYRPSPLALLVAGAFFMEFLDGSIIATALPSMAVSLHSSAVRPPDGSFFAAAGRAVASMIPLALAGGGLDPAAHTNVPEAVNAPEHHENENHQAKNATKSSSTVAAVAVASE